MQLGISSAGGLVRSLPTGFLPTIKLVNLSIGGHAEFAPKLRAYCPQIHKEK